MGQHSLGLERIYSYQALTDIWSEEAFPRSHEVFESASVSDFTLRWWELWDEWKLVRNKTVEQESNVANTTAVSVVLGKEKNQDPETVRNSLGTPQ